MNPLIGHSNDTPPANQRASFQFREQIYTVQWFFKVVNRLLEYILKENTISILLGNLAFN